MTVGERISARRKELGISVDTLAEKIGKNRATIYRYEGNEIENMSIVILEPLAKALRTTPAYLMGWTDDESNLFIVETSKEESPILKKYNELNAIGQIKTDAYVDGLLENEAYRKNNSSEEITYTSELAAFGGASKTGELTKETVNQLVDELDDPID